MTGQNDTPADLKVPARAVPDMLFRISGDNIIVDAKPGEDVEFYVPLETFLGKPITEALPPHVADPAIAAIQAAQRDGLIHTFEYQLEGADGVGYFEARVVRAGNNEIVAIVRNMTEHHRTQAMLATQSAVAEHMAQGAVIVQQRGDAIVWANTRMETMLGYGPGTLLGRTLQDLVATTTDYTHTFLPRINSSLARTGRWLGETFLRHLDGSRVWCEISISSFDHPAHGPVSVVLASDISERQASQVIEKTLGQFGQKFADQDANAAEFTDALASAIAEATGDCCLVALVNNESGQLEVVARHSNDSDCSGTLRTAPAATLEADPENAETSALSAVTTVVNNLTGEQRRILLGEQPPTPGDGKQVHALVTTPIMVFGTPIGTITTIRHDGDRPFSEQDVSLLEGIATRAGPVVENARIHRKLIEGAEFVSSTKTGMVRIGSDLTVLSWNPGAEAITGYSGAETVGRPISLLSASDQTSTEARQRFAKMAKADSPIQYEVERPHKDGSQRWLSVEISPIHGLRGAITGAAISFIDITEQRKARIGFEALARVDSLTGLANRSEFQRVLSRALIRYRRFGVQGALLVIDLDDFKHVNDEHGHQAGDDILREVADRLRDEGRGTDVVGRIGADEFSVLIDPADFGIEGAVEVAHRLLDALGKPCQIAGETVRLDASCGIALLPEDGRDPETLLQHAENAMYSAKRRGGGHVRCYRPESESVRSDEATEPAAELRQAVRRRELGLHYQPVVRLSDRRTIGFEGLVRWMHANGTVGHPHEFLPQAEESGLIIPLGYQLFDDACRFAARLGCADEGITSETTDPETACPTMSVNLSRRQFAADDLVPRLKASIARHHVDPRRITLEITETTAFDDLEQAKTTLARLRNLHIRVALDDFGTGYSSLSALSQLSVDCLKLDRTFVSRLDDPDPEERRRNKAIVAAAISLSHSMGLTIVAEGVETEVQHEFLVATGCDRGQGFLYSGATPADVAVAQVPAMP